MPDFLLVFLVSVAALEGKKPTAVLNMQIPTPQREPGAKLPDFVLSSYDITLKPAREKWIKTAYFLGSTSENCTEASLR